MLAPELKKKYRNTCALMTIPALEEVAYNLAWKGRAVEARYVRDLIAERKAFYDDKEPQKIAVQPRSTPRPASQPPAPGPILSPATIQAVKHVGLWAVVVGGGATLFGLVVWPALVALGNAVAALMVAVAPFVAGFLGVVFTGWIILSGRGEKKTVQSQSGPKVEYHQHFYFNQGQNASQQNG